MPSRLVCVAILVYWLFAVFGLVTRDLLPELTVGGPPDLRTISVAGEPSAPARWSVQVIDNPSSPDDRRSVGQAVTESRRGTDGWVEMTSKVWFDSGRLLSGFTRSAPRVSQIDEKIEFISTYHIDPSGNLSMLHAEVKKLGDSDGLWRINGSMKNQVMELESQGPLPFLNRKMSFPYKPRAVVQSQFGPLDRLPGLKVGQRWDEHAASPFTGQVETVRAEVAHRTVIHWDKSPVTTLEVVHKSKALSARTWVRPDGLVLRQEVAFPLLRLILERLPDATDTPGFPVEVHAR